MSKRSKQFERLTEQMQSGDSVEFGEFWDAVRGMVRSHLVGKAGTVSDEVMADVMTQLWESADKYDASKTGIIRWVKRQATNASLWNERANDRFNDLAQLIGVNHQQDHPGRSKSYVDPSDEQDEQGSADIRDVGPTTEEMVTGAETFGELLDVLEFMPPRRAEALALRYIEGYSIAEVARKMGISVDSVKELLMLGRRDLAGRMSVYGIEAPSGKLPLISQEYEASGRLITANGALPYERCEPEDYVVAFRSRKDRSPAQQ